MDSDHTHGDHRWHDPEHLARLLDPRREQWFPRTPILTLLALGEGMVVADVGAGSGYMVPVLATAVGRAGRVIAIDPSPAAREHLLERIGGGLYSHVEVRDGTAAHTGLPDGAVDRVLWQAVFHELPDRAAALDEARRILKPAGRLVVVDWDPATEHVGPPKSERAAREEAERLAQAAGFDVVGQAAPSPAVWALVLERP